MFKNYKIIDLTHTLSSSIPTWNGSCGFNTEIKLDYRECETEVKFRVQKLKMHAGIGTHMDAPAHCIPGGKTIADLSIESFFSQAFIIDVSPQAHPTYQLSVTDIEDFERKHGEISEHAFVILSTGWDQLWTNPEGYRNDYQFPSISEEAAKLLLKRNINGLGIDTLSPDLPESNYPVHRLFLSAGKYIIENIANAKKMPATGGYTLALPIKIQDATEAPIRLVGLVAQ